MRKNYNKKCNSIKVFEMELLGVHNGENLGLKN